MGCDLSRSFCARVRVFAFKDFFEEGCRHSTIMMIMTVCCDLVNDTGVGVGVDISFSFFS